MSLLPPATRSQLDEETALLWDRCEREAPAFRHLWSTMANSPTVFRHVFGQLLELKATSPVDARHFELAIVTVSALNRCRYCVAHHAPLAGAAGATAVQLDEIAGLALQPWDDSWDFPHRPGWEETDSLVVDLAWFVVWSGIAPHAFGTHPRVVQALRRRLLARLHQHFSARQIEELAWRIAQCVAFNWHNELFELDLEVGVGEPALVTG